MSCELFSFRLHLMYDKRFEVLTRVVPYLSEVLLVEGAPV